MKNIIENDYNVILVDIETNGLDPKKNKIIELGAVKYNLKTGEFGERFRKLIKINTKLDHEIVKLTKITDELLNTEGMQKEEAINLFMDFIIDSPILAHNAIFERKFLTLRGIKNKIYCSIDLISSLNDKKEKMNLNYLIQKHDIRKKELHRALEDAIDTGLVINKYRSINLNIIDYINELKEINENTKPYNYIKECKKCLMGKILWTINKNDEYFEFCTNYANCKKDI